MKKWIIRLGLVSFLTIGLAGNVSAATPALDEAAIGTNKIVCTMPCNKEF